MLCNRAVSADGQSLLRMDRVAEHLSFKTTGMIARSLLDLGEQLDPSMKVHFVNMSFVKHRNLLGTLDIVHVVGFEEAVQVPLVVLITATWV